MNFKITHLLYFFLFILGAASLQAQESQDPVITYNISYGYQLPFADLDLRFGPNPNMGMDVEYITSKSWIFGLGGYFIFGKNVEENVLSSLLNADTILYAENGEPAFLALKERGFYAGGHAGKIIPFNHRKGVGGLRLNLGLGFLQHKIRVQDDASAFVAQIAGDYKKGYDRLSNGFAMRQQIGYQYLSNNRRINFYVALEATQGFTKSRRSWDIDRMAVDTDPRTDVLIGVRLNWILPIYDPGSGDSFSY